MQLCRQPKCKYNDSTTRTVSGELELQDVTFGYSPLDPPLPENFNLHVKTGHWVAVVGANGSCKSTMAKIVTGLYKEWAGQILFDGVDRKEIPRAVILFKPRRTLKNIRRRYCSCFIAAHRLSTIRDCDESIVLERGKFVECGIHYEMMQHDGPYHRLIEERTADN